MPCLLGVLECLHRILIDRHDVGNEIGRLAMELGDCRTPLSSRSTVTRVAITRSRWSSVACISVVEPVSLARR